MNKLARQTNIKKSFIQDKMNKTIFNNDASDIRFDRQFNFKASRSESDMNLLSDNYALYNNRFIWIAGRDAHKRLWVGVLKDGFFFPLPKHEEKKLHSLLKTDEREDYPAKRQLKVTIAKKDYWFYVPTGDAYLERKVIKDDLIHEEGTYIPFIDLFSGALQQVYGDKIQFEDNRIASPSSSSSEELRQAEWFKQTPGIASFYDLATAIDANAPPQRIAELSKRVAAKRASTSSINHVTIEKKSNLWQRTKNWFSHLFIK